MPNQYPTSATAVATDSAGRRTTTTTNYSYASPVVAKTANYQVLASDGGTLFTNTGASGSVTFTLPTVQAGLEFTFCCTAAQNLLITGATGTLKGSAGSASGTPAALSGTTATISGGTNTSQYTFVTVVSDGTNWLLRNVQGQVAVA